MASTSSSQLDAFARQLSALDRSTIPKQWSALMKFANPPPLISKLLNDLHTNTDIEREQALLLLARFAESCSPGITARDPPSQAFLESQFLHHQKNINWGDDEEGILPDRRFAWCELLGRRPTPSLIQTCSQCRGFFAVCCKHKEVDGKKSASPCHHYQIIFVDAACSRNGEPGATAGMGGASGEIGDLQWSLPVGPAVDNQPPNAQRAELTAATRAVASIGEREPCPDGAMRDGEKQEFVIVMDSEYVCKGITEWYPAWKYNELADKLAKAGIPS